MLLLMAAFKPWRAWLTTWISIASNATLTELPRLIPAFYIMHPSVASYFKSYLPLHLFYLSLHYFIYPGFILFILAFCITRYKYKMRCNDKTFTVL